MSERPNKLVEFALAFGLWPPPDARTARRSSLSLGIKEMTQYHWGAKRFEIKGGLPRLFLHEKHEKAVRWLLRGFTGLGIGLSVISFTWHYSLLIAIALVALDWFLERTLFYYSSIFVSNMMPDYDPDQWVGTVVVSIGEPKDPRSRKLIGIWVRTEDYAKRFFDHLHALTGRDDDEQGDLRLTFIVDEDMYFVFLYSDLMRDSFQKFADGVKKANLLSKYGKEHFPLIMTQIICKGFQTTKGFALGMFLDTNPPGREFLLAPYVTSEDGTPRPAESAEPIRMTTYKFKVPHELTQEDLEYFHWHKVVRRTSVGSDA